MWWIDRAPGRNKTPYVFSQTSVGRDIFMFQMTVCRVLLQGDPVETSKRLDSSCGKLPDRLESLQKQWKEVQPTIKNFQQYFQYAGASKEYALPILRDVESWINGLISTCNNLPGYHRNNNRRGYNR